MARYPAELWNEVRAHYGTGRYSLVKLHEIFAETYGRAPSASAIRKRADKENWPKDLTEQVNQEARGQLLQETAGQGVAEGEAVRVNAEVVVRVITAQRKRLGETSTIVDTMLDKLKGVIEGTEVGFHVPVFSRGKKVGSKVVFDFLGQNESLTGALLKLSNAIKILHGQERQAFNIESIQDNADEDKRHEDWLAELDNGGDDGD